VAESLIDRIAQRQGWLEGADGRCRASVDTAAPPRVVEAGHLVEGLLRFLGEDPTREGLRRTPQRVISSLEFLTAGCEQDLASVVNGAVFAETYSEMVVVRDIEVYSLCEHHLLPFFGRAHVAYVPDGRVIGLSKLPRIVDLFCATTSAPRAAYQPDRPSSRRRALTARGRRGHRGKPPLHDDARDPAAEQPDSDVEHERCLSVGSADARRVHGPRSGCAAVIETRSTALHPGEALLPPRSLHACTADEDKL
jgi:hypothetical protein